MIYILTHNINIMLLFYLTQMLILYWKSFFPV